MNLIESAAERTINEYFQDLTDQGFILTEIQRQNFHYEFSVLRDKDRLKLQVYFGKKGAKTVLQGDNTSALFKELYQKFNSESFAFTPENAGLESEQLIEPNCYIGTDESGKGDYFGPLVIAGVVADESNIKTLKSLGVKDSKELSDGAIKKIAHDIRKISDIKFNVISINPKKYNELYSRVGNLNGILGWAHAKVIENLLEKHEVPEAISDKFGNEKYIYSSLQEKGQNITLHQVTKAERYTAVAAGSILARDRFNSWFKHEKQKLGLELPKGASENCEIAATEIMKKIGDHSLKDFAKLHFKNTQRLGKNKN